jgi:hypothetical protein
METLVNSQLAIQKWRTDYYSEAIRKTGLAPYMGKGKNNIYRIVNDLLNTAGKTINIPLIMALRGAGVTGSQVLVGNEEDMSTANDQVMVDWRRNGVVVPKSSSYVTPIDLMNAARDANMEWSTRSFKNDSIDALGGIIVPGAALTTGYAADTSVSYSAATAAQRNTYLTNNSDRILFGALTANASSNVWATALATVDTTNDRASVAIAELAKRMAENTGPDATGGVSNSARAAITPYTADDGVYQGYVMFCAPNAFRDIQNDASMIAANRDARAREGNSYKSNPLFMDGDLLKDGIIYRKLPELRRLTIVGGGSGGCNVDRNFLCGQSALTVGWGQMPTPRTKKEDDYGFRPGTAIEELRGHKKTSYTGTNYGCVEVLTASVDDA